MSHRTAFVCGEGIACPASVEARGPCLLVRVSQGECEILASGTREDLGSHPAARDAETVDLSGHVVIPALVNVHAHLDLTALGPHPRRSGQPFTEWLDSVRVSRRVGGDNIAGSVRLGIEASVRGGVVAVGDIAGRCAREPHQTLQRSVVEGVSFLELFGLGRQQAEAIAQIDDAEPEVLASTGSSVRVGFSPHAPYSAGPEVFRRAARVPGAILCTHLAESEEEHRLAARGDGPMRDFFAALGLWDDEAAAHFKDSGTPVALAMAWAPLAPWILAHVNDCSDEDLAMLASTRCTVAYCPRSSAYFEHHETFGPHRYREMMHAGINVALGTDSVLNLPDGPESERISTLDEMRFLYRRDGTDPRVLLAMATTHGARALGMRPGRFTLGVGHVAGIVAVPVDPTTRGMDPAARVVESDDPPVMLWPSGPIAHAAHERVGSPTRASAR